MIKTISYNLIIIPTMLMYLVGCQTLIKAPLSEKTPLPYEADPALIEHSENTEPEDKKDPVRILPGNRIVTETRDKQGRIIKTIFSGATLVREVVKQNGLDVVKISIVGGATIQHDGVVIKAHSMSIVDSRVGLLRGRVHIIDRASGAHLFGEQGDYDRDKQMVYLTGNPYMIVYPKQSAKDKKAKLKRSPALVSCGRMERDLAAKESRLLGDVRIHQDSWTLLGDNGRYRDGSDLVEIDQNPLIFGQGQFMMGDKLLYTVSKRQVQLDKRVVYLSRSNPVLGDLGQKDELLSLEEFGRRGGRLDKKVDDGKQATGPQLSFMTANRIQHIQAAGKEPARTNVVGDVLLTRKDLRLATPEMVALGQNFHTMYSEKGVDLLDLKQGMHVVAGVLDYQVKNRFLRLEREPKIEFYKKDTREVEAILHAAVIERDFEKQQTLARGNVRLKRGNFEAIAETATYQEAGEVILLEGDPGIKDERNLIRSEKILFYPENKRVILYRRIRGYLGLLWHMLLNTPRDAQSDNRKAVYVPTELCTGMV